MPDQPVISQIIFTGLPPRQLTSNGRRTTHHMAQANLTAEQKQDFGWQARASWDGDPLTGPLEVWWLIVWPKGSRRGKSDLDNLVPALKAIQDACNTIVWDDDSQIVKACYEQAKDDTGTWPDGCVILRVAPLVQRTLADVLLEMDA